MSVTGDAVGETTIVSAAMTAYPSMWAPRQILRRSLGARRVAAASSEARGDKFWRVALRERQVGKAIPAHPNAGINTLWHAEPHDAFWASPAGCERKSVQSRRFAGDSSREGLEEPGCCTDL